MRARKSSGTGSRSTCDFRLNAEATSKFRNKKIWNNPVASVFRRKDTFLVPPRCEQAKP
jgi:hypothetical protein